MPKSFQPLSFHLQIVLFFVFVEPLEERRRRWENEVIWKSHHRRRRACCLHNGFDEVRESWRRRAMCVLRVCVYSVGQSVCLHDYLVMKYSPKREEKKNSKPALLLLLPPPSCLYKRVTLKDWERKRRRGTHSRQRRKKKDFFKNLK